MGMAPWRRSQTRALAQFEQLPAELRERIGRLCLRRPDGALAVTPHRDALRKLSPADPPPAPPGGGPFGAEVFSAAGDRWWTQVYPPWSWFPFMDPRGVRARGRVVAEYCCARGGRPAELILYMADDDPLAGRVTCLACRMIEAYDPTTRGSAAMQAGAEDRATASKTGPARAARARQADAVR